MNDFAPHDELDALIDEIDDHIAAHSPPDTEALVRQAIAMSGIEAPLWPLVVAVIMCLASSLVAYMNLSEVHDFIILQAQ